MGRCGTGPIPSSMGRCGTGPKSLSKKKFKSIQNVLKWMKIEKKIVVPDLPIWEGVGLVTKVLA